jgi:hypothetical protein
MLAGWKRAGVAVVTSILVCASVVGILAVYHSPYILQVSWQVTRHDVEGSRWFAAHTELPASAWFASLGVPVVTTGYGTEGKIAVPEHFGYQQSEKLGSVLSSTYLVLGRRQTLGSADATLSRFTASTPHLFSTGYIPADFQRLERDPTVHRLYSNGEFDVLRITSEK